MTFAIAIFARDPAGRVKTRLELPPSRATELYAAMLHDVVDLVRRVEAVHELWYADHLGPDFGLPTRTQRGGDLGARMAHAFESMLAKHEAAIIVGSDVPTLPERSLKAALGALERHELVLGPSSDGGYYLIGARRVPSFSDVRWSGAHALADTVRANGRVTFVEPWYDVDRPEDLRLLATHLALDPDAAPRTAAALRR